VSGEGEPSDPEKGGVGICVSGGGLRAASFGLGALQALQDRRGLLRGPNAARYLSAVSGGSYIAGAYTLVNCGAEIELHDGAKGVDPTVDAPPFAPDSPEGEHLRRHCRYMAEEGALGFTITFLVLILLNLAAIVSLVVFTGVYLGDLSGLATAVLPTAIASPDGVALLQWGIAVASIGYLWFLLGRDHSLSGVAKPLAWLLAGLSGVVAVLGAGALVARMEAIAPLASPDWARDHWLEIGLAVAGVIAFVALTALLGVWFKHVALLPRLRRFGLALLTRWLIIAIGILLVSWVAVAAFKVFSDPTPVPWQVGVCLLALAGPLGASKVVDRASPHLAYRDRLNRCFSVVRDEHGRVHAPADPRAIKLTDLSPPQPGSENSFPELLICAAVNVSDVGATPAGSNVLSCVFDCSSMEVPEVADASFAMANLERLRRPTRLWPEWGPAVNLASAVAMTGAAVSPAMGKRTIVDMRALFTVLDIRLGVWLPNPLNQDVREGLPEEAKEEKRVTVGVGALLRELFGFHSEGAQQIYVTDGGHYDNLGLVELLRRECEEIWCIDASGDKPGRATALAEALLTASGELGAHVDIDLRAFERVPDSPLRAPVLKSNHVSGTVRYANGTQGKLHVVKLGITARTPSTLREYRRIDRRFPHHSTLNQIYRAERFDAYRELGWSSTQEALTAQPVSAQGLIAAPPPASDGRAPAQAS
jgi:hypothetical protein